MSWSRVLSGPPPMLRPRGRRGLCALGLVALTTLSLGAGAGDGGQEKRKPQALAISWTAVPSPPGGGIWAMTIAPSNRRVIYAATRDYNVPKTTNGGRSWSIVGERRFGAHIFAPVVVDPADSGHIYVSNGTVHESRDGGKSWKDVLAERKAGPVWALALDPAHPATLYAGTRSGAILRSSDGGATWVRRATLGGMVNRLVHHRSDGRTLYAVVPGVGLYRSTDSGARWQRRNGGLEEPGTIRFVTPDPASARTLYAGTGAGLFRTTDGGRSWSRVPTPGLQDAHALGISTSGLVLYLGLREGMYRSGDSGATWKEVTPTPWLEDTGHGTDLDILVDPADASTVYVGHQDGFLKSTDGGATWRAINKGLADDMTFTLAVDPQDPRRLWVGNFWTRGIFVTEGQGRSWSLLHAWRHAERADHYPMEIVFHSADSQVVYVTGAFGLKKTTDGGATWTSLGEEGTFKDEHTHGLAIDPVDPKVLYVGTGPGWEQPDRGAHVYRTADGGRTWVDLASGFPTGTETQAYVIAAAPSDRDVVYVGTNGHDDSGAEHREAMGVYRTANGGRSWRAVNHGLPNLNVYALAVDPKDPDTVFAGLGHGGREGAHEIQGVFRTSDGGRSWARIAGLPSHEASHIEFRPGDPRVILVSFGVNGCAGCDTKPAGRGVWGTADGGRTWANLSSPAWTARQRAVMDVVFDASGSVLYAGTDDGVFRGRVVERPPA